jgi:hypothetical protein
MIVEVLESLANATIEFTPKIFGAVVLLLIGWAIGSVVGRAIKEIIRRMKVDEFIFKGRRPVMRISSIIPLIISWSIYLLFIQAAIEVLGIQALMVAVGEILNFLPRIIEALVIILAGYGIAEYVRRQIEESDVAFSDLISKILFFLILYVAVAISLPLLNIETFLINALLLIVVGSFGAGLAIAMGLGLKDEMRATFKKYMRKLK